MFASYEAHREIERTLYRYATAIDTGDFDGFASLFEHGQWFMVSSPGKQPVLDWLKRNVVLYDGKTHTKHQITNLVIDGDDDAGQASFTCYLSIWQSVPEFPIQPIAFTRFSGTFERIGGAWWWKTHDVVQDFEGDMSKHLKDTHSAFQDWQPA